MSFPLVLSEGAAAQPAQRAKQPSPRLGCQQVSEPFHSLQASAPEAPHEGRRLRRRPARLWPKWRGP
eukprot:15442655-Alexandrium_andersonii.AAC.1